MKSQRKRFILGWQIVLGIFVARSGLQAVPFERAAFVSPSLSSATEPYQNKELEQFFKVKILVFSRQWAGVRSGMEQYLRDYPAGKMRDEALYWLGWSLDKLARAEQEKPRVVDLKTRAFEVLDRVVKEFPESLWRDDAQRLQVTIAGELAILGVSSQQKVLEDALTSKNKSEADLRNVALNSIINLNPKTAIPAMQNFLKVEQNPELKKQCVSLLGRRYTREVVGILEDVAKNDQDEEVRKEAEYWLGKIKIRLIPVQLNYYCYDSRLTDAEEYAKVPEGKVAKFFIPHGRSGSESRIKAEIRRIFKKRIYFTGSQATSRGASDPFEYMKTLGTTIRTAHNISGFRIAVDSGSINKTLESFEGLVFFNDMAEAFRVDGRNDVLLAARRSDRLAIMYLEMAPKDVETPGQSEDEDTGSGFASSIKSVPPASQKKPVYYSSHRTMGIVINSTRQSTDPDSFKSGIYDYSLAEAEIPGAGGTWKLSGHLLLEQKERVLIGRMAKLVRPDGTTAAVGDEIRVPVKDPAAFTATGGKTETGREKPSISEAAEDKKYNVSFNLEGGGWIQSARMRFDLEEFGREVIDCGLAKARIPGQGGTWILTGSLILMKKEGRIVAKDAVLMNPAGKVAAEARLITVPLKNPEKFTFERTPDN